MSTEEVENSVSLSNSRSANPPTKVYAVRGAIIGAIALALGGAGVYPAAASAISNMGQIDTVKAETVSSQDQLLALQKKQEGLAQAQETVNRFIAKFPPAADQKQLVDDLSRYAAESGVTLSAVNASAPMVLGANGAQMTPGEQQAMAPDPNAAVDPNAAPVAPVAPAAEFPLAEMTVDITASGSYDALTRFLQSIEGGNRSFVVDSVSISFSQNENGSMDGIATIKSRSFIARALEDPKTASAEESEAKAPAEDATSAP